MEGYVSLFFTKRGRVTGKKAFAILKEELGTAAHQLHVGLEMEF